MKILFSSYVFRPSIGGIETVSEILAEEFVAAGHEVELITETPGDVFGESHYRVNRRPGLKNLITLLQSSDLFFQNNISLRSLLPALLLKKRAIVVHQTWIRNARGKIGSIGRLKRMLLGRVTNVAISQAIANDIARNSTVIPNPYRDELFRIVPTAAHNRTLVFVGRLVSDKGVGLLLRALVQLRREEIKPDLTIVGAGPEQENLAALIRDLKLQDQVSFAGQRTGEELVRLLNQHRIMVIPSLWAEPFGVVALEGIACGCAIIGSEAGGLKEAIGPCGITFENGNEGALADALKRLLRDKELEGSFRSAGPKHLERFRAREVACQYLQLIEKPAQ
jgi:glycosyltransferase involved in cell wall biosynthesis